MLCWFAGNLQMQKLLLQLLVNMAASSSSCSKQIWSQSFPDRLVAVAETPQGMSGLHRATHHDCIFSQSVHGCFYPPTTRPPRHVVLLHSCANSHLASLEQSYPINTYTPNMQCCTACRGGSRAAVHAAAAHHQELKHVCSQSLYPVPFGAQPIAAIHQPCSRAYSSSRHFWAAHTPCHLSTRATAGCNDFTSPAARHNSRPQNTATTV